MRNYGSILKKATKVMRDQTRVNISGAYYKVNLLPSNEKSKIRTIHAEPDVPLTTGAEISIGSENYIVADAHEDYFFNKHIRNKYLCYTADYTVDICEVETTTTEDGRSTTVTTLNTGVYAVIFDEEFGIDDSFKLSESGLSIYISSEYTMQIGYRIVLNSTNYIVIDKDQDKIGTRKLLLEKDRR